MSSERNMLDMLESLEKRILGLEEIVCTILIAMKEQAKLLNIPSKSLKKGA